MRTDDRAKAIIRKFEGFHSIPYLCPAKIWVIGYGHTRTVRSGQKITLDEAEKMLSDDLSVIERAIERLVIVPLDDFQFNALVSFVFNVGISNFEGSTLLRLLNRGWYDQVPTQFMRWNRVNGEATGSLAKRRAAEGLLWRTVELSKEEVA